MLTVQNVKVYDLIPSVLASGYAMRTSPLEKPLDSYTEDSEEFKQGLVRANKLVNASKNSNVHCHDNFLTGIRVSFDVKYPQYWTPEFQRYHFADIVTSSSKMHKLLAMDIDSSCNKYVTQDITTIEDIKSDYYYLPSFTPNSNILTDREIILIWSVLPLQIKQVDGKLLYSKQTSPDANLETLYEICEKNDKNCTIFFMIETENDEVFGGIMTHNIELIEDGKYVKPSMAYLITVRPEITLYGLRKKYDGVVLFEPGCFRFGYGEDGPAISIDHDLKSGISERNSVYGQVDLLKDYSNEGEFKIKNMEVYLMI